MAWSTIRKATEEDKERLEAAAARFCDRYGLREDYPAENNDTSLYIVESALAEDVDRQEWQEKEARRLRQLWRRCVRRALRCNADGIGFGYVGNYVD